MMSYIFANTFFFIILFTENKIQYQIKMFVELLINIILIILQK